MSNIIPFEQSANLPAHLMAAGALALNDAAEEFSSVKFPVISVKNSRFSIKRDGEKTLLMRPKNNPNDPDEAATYIEVAILNLQKSKTYYAEGYTDGAEDKPNCFSNDGITPDSSVEVKECTTCALCPQNAWNSGRNEKGEATKGKACSDVQRLAVAAVTNLDDPMLLRVPPASLKNLAEMSKQLSKRNIPLNGVVTRVSFDSEATGVVLTFKAVGYLDAPGFAKAQKLMNDDLTLAIVGKKNRGLDALPATPAHIAEAAVEKKPEVDPDAEKKAAAAKAKADKIAKAKAELAAAEAEAANAKPEPVAETASTKVVTSATFDDELNALLS